MKNIIKKYFNNLLALIIFLVFCNPSQAKITRVIVTKTEPYLEGKVFGMAGSV